MRRHISRPSASTAVALVALFVALGGTGYAAVKLNGKNIKNRTIAGKKIKSNTLTGKQVRESKLGTVPKARQATTARSADAAAGGAAAGLVRRATVVDTDLIKLPAVGNSKDNSPLRPVFTSGPFSLRVACWNAPAGKTAFRFLFTSTEPGSVVNDETLPLEATEEQVSRAPDPDPVVMAAPSGATLHSGIYYGIKTLGGDCVVAVHGAASSGAASAR